MHLRLAFSFCSAFTITVAISNCNIANAAAETNQLLEHVQQLSSDKMAGRKPGTNGHLLAQAYIIKQFSQARLAAFDNDYIKPFKYNDKTGTNILGWLQGKTHDEDYLVVTAHYDHLGQRGNRVMNGADDNASGVAALLMLAGYFSENTPHHSMIFLATDAEEQGLYGAKAFVKNSPVALTKIRLNINLDMIANGGRKKNLVHRWRKKEALFEKSIIANHEVAAQ
jgi:hypothetical protein